MNAIIEDILNYTGIITESSPALVANKISQLANRDAPFDTLLNRVADEAFNNPENFPIGSNKTINIKNQKSREDYINNIICYGKNLYRRP